VANFATPRFQLARKAAADLSGAIYHAVKLDGSGKVVLAIAGDEAVTYGFLINNPVAGMFCEAASFGGGAKAILDGAVAAGDPLKIGATDGQLVVADDNEMIIARAWEAGVSGDIIEIEPVLFITPFLVGLTVGNAGNLFGYRMGGAPPDFGGLSPNNWGNDITTLASLFFGNTSNNNNVVCSLDESQWDGAEQLNVTLTGSPLGTYIYDWNAVAQRYNIDDSALALFFQAELGNVIPFVLDPVDPALNFLTENNVPLVEKGVYLLTGPTLNLTVGSDVPLFGFSTDVGIGVFGSLVPDDWGNSPTAKFDKVAASTLVNTVFVGADDDSMLEGADSISAYFEGSPNTTYIMAWDVVSMAYTIVDAALVTYIQSADGTSITFSAIPLD
jgi:hypothetical protein